MLHSVHHALLLAFGIVPITCASMTIRCAAYDERLSFGSIPIINEEGEGASLSRFFLPRQIRAGRGPQLGSGRMTGNSDVVCTIRWVPLWFNFPLAQT
jgi:hypothetical protein